MKIKTQVSISLIVFALLAVVIIFSVYSSNNQLQDIQKKQQIIDNIETSSSELYYLENDYIVHGGTIPAKRWDAKYAELTGQLQELTLTDPSQQTILNQMFESQNELNKSFSHLVAVTGSEQGTGPGGVSQELKEFSASTLDGQTQMFMSRTSELSQLVKADAHDVEQRTILIISFSIAVLILFVLLNYLLINRSVLKSISALKNGAERIGSGDLDTKIETISNDELGYLSHEFNEMTYGLKNSQNLLLTSNIELERKNQELEAAYEQLAAAEKELKSQFDALAESERIIRENEERFRTIINSMLFGVVIIDPKTHTIIEANPKALEMIGGTSESVLGSVCHCFICPAELGKCPVTDLLQTVDSSERVLLNLRGENIPILKSVIKTMLGEKEVLIESFINIIDRKLAEDTLLKVNQKLNVLSQLTRQDLNTQIFILNSYLEMAKKQATGQDKIIKNIENGERAVRSIRDITEFTKDYQSMGEKPPKWQNLKLSFLFGLSHISIGEIRHSLETENLEIFADPLLEKAFQGLLENSVAHGGHVSEIRVSHTMNPDGVTIVYEDDGIGISTEKKDRIFLRGEGAQASVRGLFFVREILDITGITIKETGEPGKGARFEMTVPKGAWRITGKGA